jgi:hypothetical protein
MRQFVGYIGAVSFLGGILPPIGWPPSSRCANRPKHVDASPLVSPPESTGAVCGSFHFRERSAPPAQEDAQDDAQDEANEGDGRWTPISTAPALES